MYPRDVWAAHLSVGRGFRCQANSCFRSPGHGQPGRQARQGTDSPAGPPQDFSCVIQKCELSGKLPACSQSPHHPPALTLPLLLRAGWRGVVHVTPPAPFPAGRRHSLSVWPQAPLIQPSCSEQTPDLWKVKLHPEPARPTVTAPSRSGQSTRQGGGQGPWGHSGHCPSDVMESSQMVCELRQLRFPLRSRL